MNGWFPKFSALATIASGNAGIYVRYADGAERKMSDFGIGPVWAGPTLVYNWNDEVHTQVGGERLNIAYNDYRGSDIGEWAGVRDGYIHRYRGTTLIQRIEGVHACNPRFGGPLFGYMTGCDNTEKQLLIEGAIAAIGALTTWAWERNGAFHVYQVSTGTYTYEIHEPAHGVISIRPDETPIVVFIGPDGLPWMLSGTNAQAGLTFVRHASLDPMGYAIHGELFNPDAIMVAGKLRVAASLSNGAPRYETIDFTKPRIDLRTAV